MSNSPLVKYTKISPNKNSPRNNSIKKITIHHMAGNLSLETCGSIFSKTSNQASANYGISSLGNVGMYVEEKDRSWASSSPANDNQAVTIEVANDEIGGNWHVSDAAYKALIALCVDICQRNGITSLTWTGDANGTLTCHYMFAATACPGPYLKSKMADIANEVNRILAGGSESEPTPVPTPSKSITEIANEVIAGKWGNGDDRVNKLRAAGYDYDSVQAEVNRILAGGSKPSKSITEIANEVIAGKWGNGDDRANKLRAAGYDYDSVQAEVNRILAGGSKNQNRLVKVNTSALNIRSGPGMTYTIVGCIKDYGVYTIIEEANGFGKLKSGAGWISLDYVINA